MEEATGICRDGQGLNGASLGIFHRDPWHNVFGRCRGLIGRGFLLPSLFVGLLSSNSQIRSSSAAVKAIVQKTGAGGVVGAGLGRKRKREELDCVEIPLESRYLVELGDCRFGLMNLSAMCTLQPGNQVRFVSLGKMRGEGVVSFSPGGVDLLVEFTHHVAPVAAWFVR